MNKETVRLAKELADEFPAVIYKGNTAYIPAAPTDDKAKRHRWKMAYFGALYGKHQVEFYKPGEEPK